MSFCFYKSAISKNRGFTLVELLVVIAIIGLLSTVAVVALGGARIKARDAKRISDLGQIQTAIDLYYDANGYYPPSACGFDCNGYSYSNDPGSWATLQAELSPYMAKLPKDPVNTASCGPWDTNCYAYAYGNVGRNGYNNNSYDLVSQLENTNDPNRCGLKDYRWAAGHWCTAFGGSYSNQIYDPSP